MKPKLIIHGGVHCKVATQAMKKSSIKEIYEKTLEFLQNHSALDSVEYAVKMLEDCPDFNAGTGAKLQQDGVVRMSASIMDGQTQRFGAVINIENVKNPVSVARFIMEKTEHLVLAGEPATKFAHSHGFPFYNPKTKKQVEEWQESLKKGKFQKPFGTAGAVVMDKDGHIAAATSTGGTNNNLPGRVGDVPLIGCGTYAGKYAGVSCTGHGEIIIRAMLAKFVYDKVASGREAMEAAREGIKEIKKIGGEAGLIVIDYKGNKGFYHNAQDMVYATS